MKGIILISAAVVALATLTGCMTKRQYKLEAMDLKRASSYPVSLEIVIEGPLNLPEGGKIVIPYPNQPFKPYPVTNDAGNIRAFLTDGTHTAAILGAFMYGTHQAAKGGGKKTVNNYNGEAPAGQ
ncbi:MAG: hypothetical protein J6Y62_00895 [Clostridia bacterium]|nr:hypothetical protein [Clostridia bacterium]